MLFLNTQANTVANSKASEVQLLSPQLAMQHKEWATEVRPVPADMAAVKHQLSNGALGPTRTSTTDTAVIRARLCLMA